MEHYNYFKNYQQNKKEENLYLPVKGLSLGNMSEDTYNQYKSYIPKTLPLSKENELRAYYFAIVDLGLFLDMNPDSVELRRKFDEYRKNYLELKSELEKKDNGLTITSAESENNWSWQNDWPWMVNR